MAAKEDRIVLIDTDAGTDDAMAIIMAIRAHQSKDMDFKVVAITCVDGNTKLDNVTINVTRILETMNANDIPVYRGAEGPLVTGKDYYEAFHGQDGFGDHYEPISPKLESEHGALAIIRYANQYKHKLSILALGPLTNLALAVRMDPSIKDCVKDIYLMGGNSEGLGNFTVCAEFNFASDPEGANVTLASYLCPITILPWEVCLRQGARPHEWRINVLGKINTPAMALLNNIEAKLMKNCVDKGRWLPCDQLAAAALIEPEFMAETGDYHVTVELSGKHTRGLMVVDYPNLIGQPNNVRLVKRINQDLFEKLLLWGVGGPNYK